MILCLWSRLHPLSKLLAIEDHTQNLEEQLWMGGRREVSIISHTPLNRSYLQQERSFFHGSVSTFLQLVVAPARIQNLFTHVSDIHSYNTRSATTNKFCVMSSSLEQLKNSFSRRFGVRLSNALPKNIEKSASGNWSKKQMHETLSCINIFKQENLYLTPSSILEILKLKTCKTVAILQIRPVLIVPDPFLSLFSLCSNFVLLFLFAIFHSLSLF